MYKHASGAVSLHSLLLFLFLTIYGKDELNLALMEKSISVYGDNGPYRVYIHIHTYMMTQVMILAEKTNHYIEKQL